MRLPPEEARIRNGEASLREEVLAAYPEMVEIQKTLVHPDAIGKAMWEVETAVNAGMINREHARSMLHRMMEYVVAVCRATLRNWREEFVDPVELVEGRGPLGHTHQRVVRCMLREIKLQNSELVEGMRGVQRRIYQEMLSHTDQTMKWDMLHWWNEVYRKEHQDENPIVNDLAAYLANHAGQMLRAIQMVDVMARMMDRIVWIATAQSAELWACLLDNTMVYVRQLMRERGLWVDIEGEQMEQGTTHDPEALEMDLPN